MADAAGKVQIVLSVDKATYTQAMQEAQRQLDQFAGKAKTAGHSTVSSMQASSAAVRVLRGGMEDNIRAVERFITTIPGVGAALKAAFPIVGALAFAGLLTGIATQVVDFVKKANALPDTVRNAFAALNLESQTATDSTVVLTDKLNDAHAAFEHKTANTLKTGIDEAREAADKFAASVVNADNKVNELLEKNSSGIAGFFLGHPLTGAVEDDFREYQRKQATNAYALSNAAPGSDAQKAAQAAIDSTLAGFKRDQEGRLGFRQAQGGAVAADAEGVLTYLNNQQSGEAADTAHAAAEGQAAKDEAARKAQEAAKAAAAKQLEQQKKAMEDALAAMKADHKVSVGEEYSFWQRMVDTTTKGTDLYQFALGKFGEANQAWYRTLDEMGRKLDEDARKTEEAAKRDADAMLRLSEQVTEADERMADAQAKLDDANAKNIAEMNELTIAHQLATGAISQHDAAVQEAANHAAVYAAALAKLNADKAALTPFDVLNGKGKDIDAQIAGVTGEAARTAQTDSYKVGNSTAAGGATEALQEFAAGARDAAKQMHDLVTNTLSSLNAQIVNGLTGQRTNFKSVGSGLFKSVANTGLQKAEGSLISGLFGNKQLGTASNPMHVIMSDASKVAGATAGIAGKFGGVLGGLFNAVIPKLATGGYMDGPAIVGENGPELFNPGVAGYITPNHKLSSMTNSGGNTLHVDARGSTDPAQVEAAVQRGIAQAAPHLMAGSVHAVHEQQRRRPAR